MKSLLMLLCFCLLTGSTNLRAQDEDKDAPHFPKPGELYEWKYYEEPEPGPSTDDNPFVDVNPEVIKSVQPNYPESMRQKQLNRTLYVKVLVSEKGGIVRGQMKMQDYKANKAFAEAAIEAVKQWQFSPAQKDGKPVKVWVTVPVRFRYKK